jgi:hypothetical protein
MLSNSQQCSRTQRINYRTYGGVYSPSKSKGYFSTRLKEYICILSDTEYLTESILKELETKMIEFIHGLPWRYASL